MKRFVFLAAVLSVGCGMSDEEMKRAVYTASTDGDLALLEKVLDKKPELATDNDGEDDRTPLHLAADEEIAAVLIEAGADVNANDSKLKSPLHLARTAGIVDALVAAGADVNAIDVALAKPIHMASDPGVIRALVKHGAEFDVSEKAFRRAAKKGNARLLEVMIENGGDPQLKASASRRGDGLLHVAARSGHADVMKVLLKAGVNPNDTGKLGVSPLHIAALQNKVEAVRVLLEGGADPMPRIPRNVAIKKNDGNRVGMMPPGFNQKNASGKTPMQITNSTAVKDLLKQFGATE